MQLILILRLYFISYLELKDKIFRSIQMKIIKLITLCCFMLVMFGCDSSTEYIVELEVLPKGSPVKLMVATDIHYLSPELVEEGSKFDNMYLSSDGKQMNYINEITEAFIEEVIEKKPDVLILSGDLTFNGEKKSHEELAEKLRVVTNNGIRVLVTPGNHDIKNYNAIGFKYDSIYSVDNITAKDFKNIYKDYGFNTAISYDPNSLSYVSEISEDLWLIMLDSNIYENNNIINRYEVSGELREDTLKWLEEWLAKAESKGVTPITVMHHNLIDHNDVFNKGFTLNNSEEVCDLLNKYNVKVNLSGHIHAQSIAEKKMADGNRVTDIVTSSLSVYTNQYGMIDFLPGEKVNYSTNPIDIEAWAKRNGITDEELVNFEKYSYDFFRESSYKKAFEDLLEYEMTNEERALMAETVKELNPHYFSGTVKDVYLEILESDSYKLWIDKGDISLRPYIDSILNGDIKDENNITIKLDKVAESFQ